MLMLTRLEFLSQCIADVRVCSFGYVFKANDANDLGLNHILKRSDVGSSIPTLKVCLHRRFWHKKTKLNYSEDFLCQK